MDILKYFYIILVFAVVMAVLLLTTKYLTYKSKKMLRGNYMQIVETLSLGLNNRLHLIKVDNEFFIISASNKNVEFLARVNIKDYQEEEIKNPISEVIDFKSVLKKYVNGINFGRPVKQDTEEVNKNGSDTVSNSGEIFKSNLEKVKILANSINDQRGANEQKKEN